MNEKMLDEDFEPVSGKQEIDLVAVSQARNARLTKDSGNALIEGSLVAFLHDLMRDHLAPGIVEKLVINAIAVPGYNEYSNGFLARYAENLANELINSKSISLQNDLESAFDGPQEVISDSENEEIFQEAAEQVKKHRENILGQLMSNIQKDREKDQVEDQDSNNTTGDLNKINNILDAVKELKDLTANQDIKQVVDVLIQEVENEMTVKDISEEVKEIF